jgi:hypothetical protein
MSVNLNIKESYIIKHLYILAQKKNHLYILQIRKNKHLYI